jgi:hypothetical protein
MVPCPADHLSRRKRIPGMFDVEDAVTINLTYHEMYKRPSINRLVDVRGGLVVT